MKEFIVFTDEGEEIVIDAKDFSTAYEIANGMGFTINFIENVAENSGRFV